jgi:two-component system chemotaxis response regulator CheB
MAYRILIVDDSNFFRRRIKQILEEDPELKVVGEANNGLEGLDQVALLKPDVVTMDIEMPVMDGITAVKKIMANTPVPIIMFSSLTQEGAQATLDALDAGALDFLPKKFADIALNRKEAVLLLQSRVKAVARNKMGRSVTASRYTRTPASTPIPRPISASLGGANNSVSAPLSSSTPSALRAVNNYACLAIGTSTGGPVALQKILIELPVNFPFPVLMVQHMPGAFTQAFAKRLNELCPMQVKEAEHGESVKAGCCYLAPGGKQMTVEGRSGSAKIMISESKVFSNAAYKPSVDITFDSIAKVYGGNVLGVILTGMGADGREGCRTLHALGAKIWAQDEKTSVVYGMPQAVTLAKIAQANYAIDDMATFIKKEMVK